MKTSDNEDTEIPCTDGLRLKQDFFGQVPNGLEKDFREIFDNAPIGIYQSARDRLLRTNLTLAKMFGYASSAELLASSLGPEEFFVDPKERDPIVREAIHSEGYVQRLVEYRRKDGSTFPAILRMRAVCAQSGDLRYFEGYVEDITERKEAEKRAVAASGYSQVLFQSSPIGIITCRETGEVVAANPAVAQMMGASPEDLTTQNVRLLDSWKKSGLWKLAEAAFQKGQLQTAEIRHLSTFGKDLWISVHFVPFDYQGEQNLLGLFVDITERRRTKESLRESERFAQSTLDSLSAHIAILDNTGKIVAVNRSWKKFSEENKPVGTNVCAGANYLKTCDSVTGEDAVPAQAFANGIRLVLDGRQTEFSMEYACDSPTEQRWFLGRVSRFVGEGPVCVVAVHENITARKLAEEALRESEEKFRQLAENSKIVFWLCDKEKSKMLYISPAYEEIWQRSCESLYQDSHSFAQAIHAEDQNRVLSALEGEDRGEGYEEEYRILRPDGSVRWIHDRSFIVRNARGEFYRLAGLAEDITDRKELEQQLRQAQKMEAIGQLAGGVAHDFNNILAATLMHLGLLQQNPEVTPGMKEELKEVESEVVRAASLTRQLLLFSRRQVARVEPLEVNALIREFLKMLRRILVENIQLDFRGHPTGIWVQADAGMLEQVVMNLCVNARDAMSKGGRLSLTTSLVERSAESAKSHLDARPGRFLCLTVADTGCGMDEMVLKRIFEPFFTTKEVGKGTGLGLATVHGIVKLHDGGIEVQSMPGKGSSFQIYLPAQSEGQLLRPDPQIDAEVRGAGETILLVEDDLAVRRMAALCLRKIGYVVLEASNGAEALSVWEKDKDAIQVLLTDMVMPEEITGFELAERLKGEKPGLGVIISSGYSPDLVKLQSLGNEATFIAKPFKAINLAKAVRKCLRQEQKSRTR